MAETKDLPPPADEYAEYKSRTDVQALAILLGKIYTVPKLAAWLSLSMQTSPYLDWPRYSGSLGEDSGGGTPLQAYIELNRAGILTLGSQEGFCDPPDLINLPGFNFLETVNRKTGRFLTLADTVTAREQQISTLECIMTRANFDDLLPRLMAESSPLTIYILAHPALNPAVFFKVISTTGALVPMNEFPKTTTSDIVLKSGETLIYPATLGKETLAPPLSTLDDVLHIKDPLNDLAQYKNGVLDDFISWQSKVVPGVRIHPELIFDLQLGDYVILLLTAKEKCTLPNSAASMLLQLLKTPTVGLAPAVKRRLSAYSQIKR